MSISEFSIVTEIYVRKRHSCDLDEQTDRQMCLLGVCTYVLVMLEVVNLARN